MIFNSRDVVFQDWMFRLSMQQQSVLLLAARGPDGVAKFHPIKPLVARYRATVLKAAYLGRAMRVDEFDDTTFMTLNNFSNDDLWDKLVKQFFDHADEIQHHYLMHLAHGAQIAGYKHPIETFRHRWRGFYEACCRDWHVLPESEIVMDARLGDWDRLHWDRRPEPEEPATAVVKMDVGNGKLIDVQLISSDPVFRAAISSNKLEMSLGYRGAPPRCDVLAERRVPRDMHLIPLTFDDEIREHQMLKWQKSIIAPRMEDGLTEDEPDKEPAAPWALVKVEHAGTAYYNVDRSKYSHDDVDALPYLAASKNNKEWEETEAWYQGMYAWDGSMWRLGKQFLPHWVRP